MYFLLFLGAVIAFCVIAFKELYKSSKVDDKIKLISGQKANLREKYTNYDRENQVKNFVYDYNNQEKIMAELEEDLRFIFGDDYRNKFSLFHNGDVPEIGVIYEIEKKIAIDLILSKEGLVRDESIRDGYFIMNNPNNNLVGIYLILFAQRIEHNIRKVHNDENLTLWYKPELLENNTMKVVNSWTRGYFYWNWTWVGDNRVIRAWSDDGTNTLIGYIFSCIPQPNNKDWWWFKYE